MPLLATLATLGVVLNHATWQVLGNIKPPALSGYAYLPLDQVGKLAIPAFMFIAGYFAAYATSGGRKPLPWTVVYARITRLFWPWVLWSAIWLGGQVIIGARSINVHEVLLTLFSQYYFIPMLMTYTLLAPAMTALARRSIRSLLMLSALLQVLAVALFYLQISGLITTVPEWVDLLPLQYLRFAFYFPFGLTVGMNPAAFSPLLRWRKALPWFTLLAYGLAILEGSLAFQRGGFDWQRADSHVKSTSMLISLGALCYFMVYEHVPIPQRLGKTVRDMSANTYGIYLSHYLVVGSLDRLLARFLPQPLPIWMGWAYVLLLTVGTLAVCLQMIQFSTRFKRIHQYLFG
ncbi:MAG: hypothetical protein Fur0018_07550 [Anaerolineales bacterium]